MNSSIRDQDHPSATLVGVVVAVVVLGDLFTWFYFAVSCGIENRSDAVAELCRDRVPFVPLFGAVGAAALGVHARRARRPVWLLLAAAVGAATALGLWGLWGDPAGNFSGPLTD